MDNVSFVHCDNTCNYGACLFIHFNLIKMKNRNYKARLKTKLLMGESVTPMQALKDWGCLRLASYVNRLKNDGMNIKTEIVYKNGTSYAKYSLS